MLVRHYRHSTQNKHVTAGASAAPTGVLEDGKALKSHRSLPLLPGQHEKGTIFKKERAL